MASPTEQVTTTEPSTDPVPRPLLVRYYVAALVTRTADEGARVALVLLALDRAGDAAVGGIMVMALLVPHVVAAPVVGRLVDRAARPGHVLAAAVTLLAAGLALAAALVGRAPTWTCLLVLAVAGCGGPAITGGLTSRLGALVPENGQPRAFGLDSLFYNVASIAGPTVVAVVAVVADPGVATLGLAALAGLGAVLVLTIRVGPGRPDDSAPAGMLDGVRAVITRPALRNLTLTTTLGQLGPGALAVVAPVLAATFHRPEAGALLVAVVAAGSLVGSLVWTWRPAPSSLACVLTGWSMIGIAVPLVAAGAVTTIADPRSFVVVAVLFGVSGFFIGPFAAALFQARNQLAPPAVRAQVFTIGAGLKVAASAAGAASIGIVVDQPGSTQLWLVAATPLCAGVLGVLLLRGAR